MLEFNYKKYFENKKITVLGLGLLGRGLYDTEFMLENGAEIICTDTRNYEKLKSSVDYLTEKNFPNLKLIIGENREEDFTNPDFVMTCAGLQEDYKYLEIARNYNVPIFMSAAFLVYIIKQELKNVTVIGITGTRGKSTTTELIAHILKSSGKTVHLGGNVRGAANLPILKEIKSGDYLVLELDSWQLQAFKWLKLSPDIAVFTSFLPDHMNYYHNDMGKYFDDKANIFKFENCKYLIASQQAGEEINKRIQNLYSNLNLVIPEIIEYESNLIGMHNKVAVSLASEVAKVCDIEKSEIKLAIKNFQAVDGRLQKVKEARGITIYNDNNATTQEAVIAGIRAITETYKVKPIVILGGKDKELNVDNLSEVLQSEVKDYVLLSGSGTDTLKIEKKNEFEKLEDCMYKAMDLASVGDVILFSPGFASFSKYFNNEYERNDEFMRVVGEL